MYKDMFATEGSTSLRRLLGATGLNQKFISNNIANAKTPGYVSQNLDFTEFVKMAQTSDSMTGMFGMMRTSDNHIPTPDNNEDSPFHLDGEFLRNFVRYKPPNEEEEMVNLASNSLAYKSAADLISREYRIMSTAITGGR